MATATWYSDGNHDFDATNAWNSQADGGGTAGNPDNQDDHCIIQNGDTVTLTGGLETGSVFVDDTGTIVGGNNTLSLKGSSDDNLFRWNGTISGDLNIKILGGDNKNIKDNGGTGDIKHLTLQHDSTGNSTYLNSDLTLTQLTITAGGLNTDSGNNRALTVTGTTTLGPDSGSADAGRLTCNASAVSLGSGKTDGAGLHVRQGGTFTGGSGTHTIGSIVVDNNSAAKFTNTSDTTTVNGHSNDSTRSILIATNSVCVAAGTMDLTYGTASNIQCGNAAGINNLTLTGNVTYTQSNSLLMTGNLTITSGTTLTTSGSNYALTVTGSTGGAGTLTLNNSTYTGGGSGSHLSMTGTVTIGTSGVITNVDQLGETSSGGMTFTCTGSPTLGCRRWRQLASKWTPATSTLKVEDGSYSFQDATYGVPYNFEIDSGNTNELAGAFTVSNNLTITSGTLDTTSSNHTLTVTGNLDISGTLTCNASDVTVRAVELGGGGTLSAPSNSSTNGLIITQNLTDSSDGDAFDTEPAGSSATFTHNNGTVTFKGNKNVQIRNTSGENFYDVVIDCAAGGDQSVETQRNITIENDLTIKEGAFRSYASDRTITVNGDVSIENGGVLGGALGTDRENALDYEFGSLTIESGGEYLATTGTTTLKSETSGGSYSGSTYVNDGTFTHNNGTLLLHADIPDTQVYAGSSSLYNVTSSTGNNVWLKENITIANDMTITSGTFGSGGGNDKEVTVHGNVFISGGEFGNGSETGAYTVKG